MPPSRGLRCALALLLSARKFVMWRPGDVQTRRERLAGGFRVPAKLLERAPARVVAGPGVHGEVFVQGPLEFIEGGRLEQPVCLPAILRDLRLLRRDLAMPALDVGLMPRKR